MRLPVIGITAFIIGFVAVHFLVLNALPGRIMSTARERIGGQVPLHTWQMSDRITPQTQTIVRPSPDLAYAICVIDLSTGPVEISVPTWPEYGSLSVFDANTDNVYAGSLDARLPDASGARRILVAMEGQDTYTSDITEIVTVDSPEALALIRRLAPSQGLYDAAAALVPASTCGPV
ncbi:MAG: DUF1254 domain-containing protein [Hyphomonas sp.]